MNINKKIISIAIIVFSSTNLYPWETYDKVLAVVDNQPIIESEVNLKLKQLQKRKRISPRKIPYEKSRILDSLIETKIIFETAKNESIQINNKRVITQLENYMLQFFSRTTVNEKKLNQITAQASKNLEQMLSRDETTKFVIDKNLNSFIDYVEKKEKIPFLLFFEEMRTKIAKEHIMSIAIGATPPSESEAKEWFRKNKSKIGFEILSKHILIIPKSKSLAHEKEANDKIEKLRKRILAGESFETLAKKYSQDPNSAAKGGDLGWQMIAELDPYFVNNIYRMRKKGQISRVFKSNFGYHIVKYMGRRDITYDKIKNSIMYKLHTENRQTQFTKWINKKKQNASIQIYMKNYIKG